MDFDDKQKSTAIIAAAAAAGVSQTIILRKTMDTTTPVLVPQLAQLGAFAKPSSVIGIAGGLGAIVVSLFVMKDSSYTHALAAYGAAALVSGILSGAGMMA